MIAWYVSSCIRSRTGYVPLGVSCVWTIPTISSSRSIQNPVLAAPPQEKVPLETGNPEVAGFVTTEPVMPKPMPQFRTQPVTVGAQRGHGVVGEQRIEMVGRHEFDGLAAE